jgi:protein-disulfide isomerase
VILLGILTVPASCEAASAPTCQRPLALQVWSALFEERAGVPADASVRQTLENFREAGSANAPITCEIYSDYQCPACAAFFRETMPRLAEEYVQTGKIRIVHRDFPLPQHRYAHMAARYANAAGRLGQYDAVVKQLFATQHLWEATGEIDTQVAQVLPPGLLAKVRDLVKDDQEALVNADIGKAREDQIRQTPSLVVVINGKRQVIAPIPTYSLLKMYLDSLLVK